MDGDVTGVGGGYIVALRLVPRGSGKPELASFRETGDGPRGLIDAADKLARALRSKAGESLRSVKATPPLAEVTTTSLDALRKYTQAYRLVGAGRYLEGAAAAREAIRLDTGFVLAYRQLEEALVNGGISRAEADSAIAFAFARRERLGERERLSVIGDYYMVGPGRDRAKAIDAFLRQAALGDYSNTNSVAMALETRQDYALADSLGLIRMRVEPDRRITFSNRAYWLINAGRLAAADTALEDLVSRFPNNVEIPTVRAALALARDSLTSAKLILDSATANARPGQGNWTDLYWTAVSTASEAGRDRDAERFIDRIASNAGSVTPEAQMVRGLVGLNIVTSRALADGPSPQLVRTVDSVTSSPAFAALARSSLAEIGMVPYQRRQPFLEAARAYAVLGATARARAMLVRYEAEVRDTMELRLTRAEHERTRGYVALAKGRPREAIPDFIAGSREPDGPATACAACLHLDLGAAYAALGQRDSTIAHLEQFALLARLGGSYTENTARLIAPMEERLGQLYEEAGDATKALAHYQRFVHLWQDADAPLQPRVAAARARIAKLAPIEKPQ